MRKIFKKGVSFLLAAVMVLGLFATAPITASAANDYTINSTTSTDDYYNLISKKDWDIAPGITESEIVLNSDDGSQRQVLFVMEADLNNEYVKVINSYTGMIPEYGNYQVSGMTNQAAIAEEMGYGSVVGAMNTTLSWYTGYAPDRINEPLGFIMLDAEVLFDPANCGYEYGKVGFPSVLVINKDFDENGNPRPADIPKVEMPQITSAADLDGWEDQVIPCSSGYIVKDGVNQSKPSHTGGAPRSVVGIKPDGTVVIMVNDGRQAPYSEGMSMYELAEVMLDLGCSYAVNCDGGGSTTWVSQRPGEELQINNSPSDGAERSTTTGILFISTAPATGEFVRANITTDNEYFVPGSTVEFEALGTDLVGTAAEIPEDASWQIKEEGMGTIEDGVFVSNGTAGTVTAQMVYNGAVVGEKSVEIVIPEDFSFNSAAITVPFDKTVTIGMTATINDGRNAVVFTANDVELTTTNSALGVFDGFSFTSVTEAEAPEDLTSKLTATLKGTNLTTTTTLSLGKGTEVIEDFENGVDGWNVGCVNNGGINFSITPATGLSGQVHDGDGSLKFNLNGLNFDNSAGSYKQVAIYPEEDIIIKNAKSIGAWVYIPDEFYNLWIRFHYYYENADGTYTKKNTIPVFNQPGVYNEVNESGWYYFSVDVSAYNSVMIKGGDTLATNEAKNCRFIEFNACHMATNDIWTTINGTLNGNYTVYVDSICADFSEAVDDREAPVFSSVSLIGNESETAMENHKVVSTTSNVLNIAAKVSENTTKTNATGLNASSAKVYVDGVLVDSTYSNGKISVANLAVADGVHRVKFEISDNAGNKAVVIRLVEVKSGVEASTIKVAPKDASLDRLYGGSVYWMDLTATDIETIQSVETVIDLNSSNHWELDHMEVAKGFTSTYSVDEETNTATITITRTGKNTQTGEAVLASLPIRVIYYDTDINLEGYTAETYWKDYNFWSHDVKVDVDMGKITYVAGYASNVLNTFSNEEFSVDTEWYTSGLKTDATYKAERATSHVHTVTALEDKAVTCTEDGYTGRTYCEVCQSVVDWGTVEKATGEHNYVLSGSAFTCTVCGDSYAADGLVKDGEVYRYYVDGVAQTGWIMIDTDWHYFHADTKAAKEGKYEVGGIEYEFEETGKLVSGVWAKTLHGMKYYYGPSCYGTGWAEIDGNRYYFENTYRYEGYRMIFKAKTRRWYNFGDDGICREDEVINGFYNDGDKGMGYVVNNVGVEGLHKIDGDYYYFNYYGYAVSGHANVGSTYCDLPTGKYYFGEDYKAYNGLLETESGKICYYKNGRATMAGLVEVDGEYYFAEGANGEIVTDETTYVWKGNGILPEANYTFDKDGKLVDGIAEVNGTLCYYENGQPKMAGLVEIDGDYYFAGGAKGELTVGKSVYVWKSNGLLPEGTYTFGADGKLLNGVSDMDGVLRYYKNGQPKMAGLVEIDGEYYFAYGKKGEVATGAVYVWETNGIKLENANCEFGADGKMLNGIVEKDGTLYYYVMGRPKMAGLIEVDGAYYFAGGAKGEITVGKVQYVWKNDIGVTLENGNCEFGADGKMLDGIVEKDGTLYYYVMGRPKMAGLIEVDGAYYFAGGAKGEITVNKATYVWKSNGILPEATYEFGADGKMLQGIVDKNGTLVYYENGKPRMAGLIEIDGDYYFADGANGEITVGRSKYVWQGNGILPEATYEFGADGKMLDGFVTKDDGIYYYENGQFGTVGLNYIDGEYYFVDYGGKIWTNGTYYVWRTNGFSICMNYTFDELGRLVR